MVTEEQRVSINRGRARRVGQTATLTLQEWEQTIRDFGGYCAYCLTNPFTILEHYLPVEIAGTHAKNCIPACASCNRKKNNHRGEVIRKLFGVARIEHIEQYLAARQCSSVTNSSCISEKTVATKKSEQAILFNGRLYYTASQAQAKLGLSTTKFRREVSQKHVLKVTGPRKCRLYRKRDIDVLASLDT